ncbi:MAG: hypothetical protein WAT81_01525 [Candidatus Moraniibacteriota bacterium]
MKRSFFSLAIVAIPLITGCAAAGDLAKTVGSGLTDYSSRNTGFLAGAAGVAGGVYTQAGNIVSPAAQDSDNATKKKE